MQDIFKQVLIIARGMWNFRWPGLVAAWVVSALGVVVVWTIPDRYEAVARVYVDTDSILKPLMSGLAVQPNIEQQIGMLSRTLISRPNIEKLIRMADLDLKSGSKLEQDALVDKVTGALEIRATGGTNLYSMAYRDVDPDKAKRVIQSLVSIFVESGLGASRKDTDSAKTFLSEQIKTFEAKLEEAEARLKEFRLRNIERQSGDGKDSTARVTELYALIDAAKLQLREAEKSRDAAKKQLADARALGQVAASASTPASRADILASIQVATPEIDARIDGQKRNLDSLLQRYTDQHPDVQSARRLITELEEQKRKEVAELQRKALAQRLAAGTPGAPAESLAAQELSRLLATSEVQVAAIQARLDEFQSRYALAKAAMKTAPQVDAEFAQLNRDYAITKKNYEDLVARRQSAVMSGELDVASGVAEFRLIDPPRVAPKPVSPNRPLLIAAVLVVSLGAGVALTFVASQLRPTFSDAEALRLATGLPLLGVVSLLTTDADRRRQRLSLYRFVGASGGLVGVFMAGLIAMALASR
jgi:polysaccharide chain length determinant protein (PEP-CTERM system associated)